MAAYHCKIYFVVSSDQFRFPNLVKPVMEKCAHD